MFPCLLHSDRLKLITWFVTSNESPQSFLFFFALHLWHSLLLGPKYSDVVSRPRSRDQDQMFPFLLLSDRLKLITWFVTSNESPQSFLFFFVLHLWHSLLHGPKYSDVVSRPRYRDQDQMFPFLQQTVFYIRPTPIWIICKTIWSEMKYVGGTASVNAAIRGVIYIPRRASNGC